MSNKKNKDKSDFEDIDKLIDNTFEKLKNIVDANTIIGSTITLSEGMYLVPISKISVGLISGGGEVPAKKDKKSVNACSTTGFTVTPIGFVSVNNGVVEFISSMIIDYSSNKLLDAFANIYEKIITKNEVKDEES